MALPPPNNGVAPICNAKPKDAVFKTVVPVTKLAPLTSAGDTASAIIALQKAVNALTNPVPKNNTTNSLPITSTPTAGGKDGTISGGDKQKKTPATSEWKETQRNTQNVKVVNPDDDSQFVIVKEITFLEFTNSTTGETITLRRDPQ